MNIFFPPVTFIKSIESDESKKHLKDDLKKVDWQHIFDKTPKTTLSTDQVEKEVKQFTTSLTKLLKTIENADPSDPSSANKQFILQLRKALQSPVYQALKEDPTQPCIRLLHRFASDMWNKAPSTSSYQDLGKSIMHEMDLEEIDEKYLAKGAKKLDGGELATHLEASQKKMEDIHWSDHGSSGLFYKLTHPRQTLGAMASEGGVAREVPAMVGVDQYDSHGTLLIIPQFKGLQPSIGMGRLVR